MLSTDTYPATRPVPAPTLADVVATWPARAAWNHVLVHHGLDPDNSHPVAVALYDEALDSVVVADPSGRRHQTVFCREATTREWLWRRGWVDETASFLAAIDRLVPLPAPATGELDDALARLSAACESSPRGVTVAFVARGSGTTPADVKHRLDALVSAGRAETSGGGAVVLYRPVAARAG